MSEDGPQQQASSAYVGLRPHEDARAIVRLFQCAQCSYPIREPMTLPCGHSICRPCMPLPHVRANITYPQNAGRAEGFGCPFKDCGMEHSVADCSLDVTLNKMVEVVKGQILANASRSRVSTGGRIVSAFVMADVGELDYQSEVAFTTLLPGIEETIKALDAGTADGLREIARSELECHVCYGLMVDPLTTSCGHTFCRNCVARVLDHSTLCPACRRPLLSMRPGVSTEPSNKRVSLIINSLLADDLTARIVALREDDSMQHEGWMPLFPCTNAYPNMPTFLHVFEPRYRLMIRRCLDNGSRKFGMVMYNQHRISQGNLGRSQYLQYGTVLHISRIEIFPDGRSLIETQGAYRFRVLEATMLDGYHVARIQRIEDMPLAEEEAAEALETRGPEPNPDDFEARISHMSTQALLQHGLDFIQQARSRSADWLHERVLAAYGQPPTDPAAFPFWFASVLPINEDEKYTLLPATSVRERLKMTARWIRVLEEARCASERFLRLARPLQPELEASESVPQEEAPSATIREPEAATIETAELYQVDDPQETDTEDDSPNQSQAQQPSNNGN